jgi:hypothetical protein
VNLLSERGAFTDMSLGFPLLNIQLNQPEQVVRFYTLDISRPGMCNGNVMISIFRFREYENTILRRG